MNRNLYLTNNKDVKKFINNSYLFLILFIILISKNFIFSLFKPRYTFNESILLSSLYEQINKINIIKDENIQKESNVNKIVVIIVIFLIVAAIIILLIVQLKNKNNKKKKITKIEKNEKNKEVKKETLISISDDEEIEDII